MRAVPGPLRLLTILVALALPVTLRAANPAATDAHEAAAAAAFARARENPLLLQAFLRGMPKGGDLHMHLSGAIYAETFIADAAEDGLCVDRQSLTLLAAGPRQVCADGQTAAAHALGDQALYDRMVDAFSMRSFVPFAGFDGHDKFFASFDHFRLIDASHTGEWLAEVATRAAAQNESYLEIMITPGFRDATALAASIDWPALPADKVDFATLRGRLLAAGVREHVAAIRRDIRAFEARRDLEDHCGQPAATAAATATAACGISMRYLFQVLRGLPPAVVYAQTLLGFETVAAEVAGGDPRYVGINFVMPEDGLISMRDYHLQMRMLDYLHSVYPQVRISLHAGELVQGLVPPEGLRFHIRQAIELGHAERIGHGVDVLYEDDPTSLLAQMARRHVMVEINLTSNDVILGVSGTRHPLPLYLSAGVPVALSTDDEGVSRIDLTHEYVRAVTDFGLRYADLKRSARVSLEHSFLPGASLWAAADEFTAPVSACGGQSPGALQPTAACSAYLRHSDRAAAQWELESRINRFESTFDDPRMP